MFQRKGVVCQFSCRFAIISAVIFVFSQSNLCAQAFDIPLIISGENGNAVAPQIASDSRGDVNVVWLQGAASTRALFFSRSSDAGRTFSAPLNISNDPESTVDSEHIVIDPAGNIFIVWSEDTLGAHHIFFSRSTDNAATFSVPRAISEGVKPALAVDSAGVIELAWIDKGALLCDRSYDEGWTFSTPIQLSLTQSAAGPDIAVDSVRNVYIVWTEADERTQTSNVFFTASSNEGFSFLPATDVSIARVGISVANPRIEAASPSDINILWMAHAEAVSDSFVYIHSSDGGATFGEPVTETTNGDAQLALDTSGGADLVWQELNGNGRSLVRFARYVAGVFSLGAIIASSAATAAYPQLYSDSTNGIRVALVDSPNAENKSSLVLLHSTDRGATFSQIETFAGGSNGPPQIATGPMGTSYVAWSKVVTNGNHVIVFHRTPIYGSLNLTSASTAARGSEMRVLALSGPAPTSDTILASDTPQHGETSATGVSSFAQNNGPSLQGPSPNVVSDSISANRRDMTISGNLTATNGQNSLAAYQVNRIEYVDCNKYSCSPDIGVGINAAVADLPSCFVPEFSQAWDHCGTIVLPNGSYYQKTTVSVSSPFVQIEGQGAVATYMRYTGSGCAFSWTALPFNSGGEGGLELSDLTIDGANSQGACGIHYYDVNSFSLRNVDVRNFSSALPNTVSAGLWADALDHFSERPHFYHVQLYNNNVGWFITSNNPRTGTTEVTFGYGDIDLAINVFGSETAVLQKNISSVATEFPDVTYANVHLIVNGNGSTGTGIRLDSGAGNWCFNNYNIHIEGVGIPISLGTGRQLEGTGNVQWSGGTNSLASGSDVMTNTLYNNGSFSSVVAGDPTTCKTGFGSFTVCGRKDIWPFAVEYDGLETFAVDTQGNVKFGATVTAAPPRESGQLVVSNGSFAAGSPSVCTDSNGLLTTSGCGVEQNHANGGLLDNGSCTTPQHAFASCISIITLFRPEKDTNYAASCTGVGPKGWPYVIGITSKTLTSVMVKIGNGSGPAALASSFNEIDCTVAR